MTTIKTLDSQPSNLSNGNGKSAILTDHNSIKRSNFNNIDSVTDAYNNILLGIGEDPNREGLQKTPHRAAKAIQDLTRGYSQTASTLLNGAIFEEEYDDMVVVKDIEFYSLCEHHLLPFYGRVHVGYIPNGKIVGLSKIPRLVEMYARRLQVQERLTKEIAEALADAINPKGVAVVIDGMHMCMMMRGVEKQSASMVTSHVMGDFREDRRTRQEFMALVKGNGRH
jgi:GTP cyclohydrolase I